MHRKIVIIGSGPAGYTAAIYASRALLQPTMFLGEEPGGQLSTTTDVENYPGVGDVIQGPELIENMHDQAEKLGAEMLYEYVSSVDFSQKPFTINTSSGETYTADSVIVSTGAKAKWLGLDSEDALKGKGVSACATCDGFFYKGKDVVVVGGGNTAVEEAIYLSEIAKRVTIVHRGTEFRAEKILQEKLRQLENVDILFEKEIHEITPNKETGTVEKVILKDKNGSKLELETEAIFVAIGHAPATEIFIGQLELKENGYIKVEPGRTKTSVPGVFAAGDVADDVFRQAITAAGMGCMAALEAEKYLRH